MVGALGVLGALILPAIVTVLPHNNNNNNNNINNAQNKQDGQFAAEKAGIQLEELKRLLEDYILERPLTDDYHSHS